MLSPHYALIYLLTNLFGVYTIRKFMLIFFKRKTQRHWFEPVSYALYYVLISLIYFHFNIPAVLGIVNILAFILLTYNYEATLKTRLLAALDILLVLMSIELVVAISNGYLGVSILKNTQYQDSFSFIFAKMLSYIVVLSLSNFKHIRKGSLVTKSNWLAIFLIPLASLYITVVLFQTNRIDTTTIVIAIALLMAINVFVFHLYDSLLQKAEVDMENNLLLQQNRYYSNQFELLKTSEEALRNARHDWKNHIMALSHIASECRFESVQSYIQDILISDLHPDRIADTGNPEFDSVLNFKLSQAKSQNYTLQVELAVPSELRIKPYDATTLLCNLIDNAVEAQMNLPMPRLIDLKIRYSKGRLFIEIANPYEGHLTFENNLPVTRKSDKTFHGIGLKQVQKIIAKYEGTMKIETTSCQFKVIAMLYV